MANHTIYYSRADDAFPDADDAPAPLLSYDSRDPVSVSRAEAALRARFGRSAPPLTSDVPRARMDFGALRHTSMRLVASFFFV